MYRVDKLLMINFKLVIYNIFKKVELLYYYILNFSIGIVDRNSDT